MSQLGVGASMPDGVAVVALRIITGTTAVAGAEVGPILREFGLTAADLADDRRRVPWDTVIDVVERLGQVIGEEAFVASGAHSVQTLPDFAPLALHFLQPFSLMRFVCEVADQAVYPMMTFKVDMLGPLRFNIRLGLAPGYRPSELFFNARAYSASEFLPRKFPHARPGLFAP